MGAAGPPSFEVSMSQFLDFDHRTGVQQLYDTTPDNRMQIHYRQDVEPILELAKYERLNGLSDAAGKKNDLNLYARIPPVIILELKYKHGVDVFKRGHMKKALQLINTEYPHLKCTDKTHTVRN
jgi:hypothetical protein